MIGVTNHQFPKYTTEAIIFDKRETWPIPPLEMGKEVCWQTKEVSGHTKELGPKSFPNMRMKVKSKGANWCWKFKNGGK